MKIQTTVGRGEEGGKGGKKRGQSVHWAYVTTEGILLSS